MIEKKICQIASFIFHLHVFSPNMIQEKDPDNSSLIEPQKMILHL